MTPCAIPRAPARLIPPVDCCLSFYVFFTQERGGRRRRRRRTFCSLTRRGSPRRDCARAPMRWPWRRRSVSWPLLPPRSPPPWTLSSRSRAGGVPNRQPGRFGHVVHAAGSRQSAASSRKRVAFEPQIACLGNQFFDTTTPQPKRLRPDIPWGNILVWTKPFYTGTITGLCILAQGWVVLQSLAVDYD